MKVGGYPCASCSKPIACTSDDPVISTRKGNMHYECFKQMGALDAKQEEERREVIRQRRSDGQRKRLGGQLIPGCKLHIREDRLEQYQFIEESLTADAVLTLDRISGLQLICAFNGIKLPVQRAHVIVEGDAP